MMHVFFLSALFVVVSLFQANQPIFKGGSKRLDAFISQNLIYPEYSRYNCLQGTVQVSFRLNSTGKVFGSYVQKGYKTDLDKEALRIVRLTSGKWIVPSGYDTSSAIVLPIKFILSEFKCEERGKDEINAALVAYRSRENLTNAVINFYNRKTTDQYSVADEQRILDLKAQLGYDDKFISRLIKQANAKLKQGDKEGACEDYSFVRGLGSDAADKMIAQNCAALKSSP